MQEYQLIRNVSTPEGTSGVWWREGFKLYTIELPWKNNEPDMSCIPDGGYICVPYKSPLHGGVFLLEDVRGRVSVEVHVLNWAGDSSLGYMTDSKGCIGVGTSLSRIAGQLAVASSAVGMELLRKDCDNKPFKLRIIWRENI